MTTVRAGMLALSLLWLSGSGDPPRLMPIADAESKETAPVIEKIERTEEEWRKLLTPEEFHVLREHGTECAFTGEHAHTKTKGIYRCAGCGLELFDSDHKFDSGTGWPSFWQPAKNGHIGTQTDRKFGMVRTEVHCIRCGGHLGHVFEDGPKPTGLRYCINSAAIKLDKSANTEADETKAPAKEDTSTGAETKAKE